MLAICVAQYMYCVILINSKQESLYYSLFKTSKCSLY